MAYMELAFTSSGVHGTPVETSIGAFRTSDGLLANAIFSLGETELLKRLRAYVPRYLKPIDPQG